ncbi:hypothetical protein FA13DRAFT_1724114 [Coprinellus micaceus]|uniref:G-patch domain-containing protein n=1 Tax=Coprinellus micaceus TaxID=71717 RepID=A0A4Y7U288_COPMI|nr:hypothetical protein FA13DRAFT_1724114 [Coprinellus micaceus]
MATQSYTVYSDYDPEKDRERLLRETGQQIPDDKAATVALDPEEQWRKEASIIYKRASLATSAPKFVPAKVADGEWDNISTAPTLSSTLNGKEPSGIAGWYLGLTANSSASASASPAPTPSQSRPPSAPASTPAPINCTSKANRPDKNNWFIQNVISASPSGSSSHTPFSIPLSSDLTSSFTPAATQTLADILGRDPPQEGKHTPPVWISLGPGNKGFGMLQKSGWNEGEALGPYARLGWDVEGILGEEKVEKWKGKQREAKVEYVEVPATRKRVREDDEVTEVRKVETIDLTLDSDDESEGGSDEAEEEPRIDGTPLAGDVKAEEVEDNNTLNTSHDGHGGTALLTPISTILKSDKLGIGLKPKLTSSASSKGAYRVPILKDTRRNQVQASTSRGFKVTSTQGVLDELRRREREERERRVFGKGRRGKERKRRKEEQERKGLLAYMNA